MSDRWIGAFRKDPQKAVADLFNGRAGPGSSMGLDVPELLHLWFPPTLAEERAQLDGAILAWLIEVRGSYASQVERLGFSVYGKRVGDALIALQLLDLPQARDNIRKEVDDWLRWLAPLRLAPERDPALECHRLLTYGQFDRRHTSTWLRLAADGRPEYLTVALAGLQRLPNGGNARENQVLMLQALLHHATTTFHDVNRARSFFNRRLGALRGRYPLGRRHWRSILEEALPSFLPPGKVRSQLAKDLVDELRGKQPANHGELYHSHRKLPAPRQQWSALLSDIRSGPSQPRDLARRLYDILEKDDDYALATGDSYPFVRTLCNLGREMLEHHTLSASDMGRFGVMIERALAWEPVNPYCWMLWAKWYQVQGQQDAEEAILREMLRMFPRDVPSHVELARLLIWRGDDNWQEAEHYLRRAIEQDSNNGHAHVVMAHLQFLRGRPKEAKATLKGFLADNPKNQEARSFLDQLQAGQPPGGTAPSTDTSRDVIQAVDAVDTSAVASTLHEILRRGKLATEFNRARFANGSAVRTTRIRQESRVGDSLAGFYSQWLELDDTPACPPNAWAWDACQHWQRKTTTSEDWQNLAERFPEAATETEFLRSLARLAPADGASWHGHGTDKGSTGRAVDILMHELTETWEHLVADHNANQHERDEVACALMACAAAGTLEFAVGLD